MLTVQEIKTFIDEDISSDKKRKAAVGQKYYESEHDILDARLFYYDSEGKIQEDKVRSNIKISHPFFKILIDELSPYMLSFEEHPIRANKNMPELQEYLDEYFDDDFWSEIGDLIDGTGIKGFEYLYGYKNENNRMTFECADSMGVVDVKAKYTKDKKDYKIYHYLDTDMTEKGKKEVIRIQVWDDHETWYYVQEGKTGEIELDKSVEINPRPHVVNVNEETGEKTGVPLGFIPFWRLDNNKKQFSSLKPVKPLIDDYDLHACSLSNNLKDFDTPLHVVHGFQGDNFDELFQNVKTKKMIGVDEGGGVEIKTVDIPYQARKEKLEIDERNIYIFGMGFNPAQVGDGNITNIVIKSRYTLIDLRAEKLEKRLKKLLKQIVKVVLDEINAEHGSGYQLSDVTIERFQKNTPTNDSENIANEKVKAETRQIVINTILNVAAQIGDEQALKMICDEFDIDFEEVQAAVEEAQMNQGTAGAMAALEGVVIDEPKTEVGATAIPE